MATQSTACRSLVRGERVAQQQPAHSSLGATGRWALLLACAATFACGLEPSTEQSNAAVSAATTATDVSLDPLFYNPVIYNWEFYLDYNRDIRLAGVTTAEQAKAHWSRHGMREGRRASAEFWSTSYLDRYPDVAAAVGSTNYADAIRHFLQFGNGEGRAGVAPGSYGMSSGDGNATVGNQAITVRTSSHYAGAVTEIWFRGRQIVDSHDTGRLVQTALSFDGQGECFNPTEGGSAENGSGQSSSVLRSIVVEPGAVATATQAAYWHAAGLTGLNCGTTGTALGSGVLSDTMIYKTLQVGYAGDPNIMLWRTQVSVTADHASMGVEALTGYHTGEMTLMQAFDPFTQTLVPTSAMALEQADWSNPFVAYPLVFSTEDGSIAVGVVGLDQDLGHSPVALTQASRYGAMTQLRSDQNDRFTKWTNYFEYNPAPRGEYQFTTFLALGNLEEVRQKMVTIYRAIAPTQALSLLSGDYGWHGYSRDHYYAASADLHAWLGTNPQKYLQHFFQHGIFEGRQGSPELNPVSYLSRYPDLAGALGSRNPLGALKHYLQHGLFEGRDGH
jgi:hypothetical protein